MNRSAQTFSLVHLVELVLAALVISIVGLGLVGMITGIQFYEQFFARDTAYMIESLHAAPNGNIEYGYLWSSTSYYLTVQQDRVSVAKSDPNLGGIIEGSIIQKFMGSGHTFVKLAALNPRYLRFELLDNRIRDAPTTDAPRPVINVEQMSTKRTCPAMQGFSGIEQRIGISGDAVGTTEGTRIVQRVHDIGSGNQGLSVAFVYEASPDSAIRIIDRASTPLTEHVSCILQQQSVASGVTINPSSLSVESTRLQSIDADMIIVISSEPNAVTALADIIAQGLADSRGGSK